VKFFRPFIPLLIAWALSFLGWGLVGFVLGVNFVGGTDIPWTEALRASIRDQLPWALLTPLVFRFATRHLIDRGTWIKNLLLHSLVGGLVIWGIHQWKIVVDSGPGPHRDSPPVSAKNFGPQIEPPVEPPPSGWDFFHFASVEIPIYVMMVTAAHTLRFYRRAEIRAGQLARARLQALQAQLQPHFLFNTLNTIAGLVHKSPDKADSVLTMLGDLLRFSLETSGETQVPLQHEIEFTEKYLEIMQVRYGERVRYEFQIARDVRSASVPALLLQPLVENAVKYAIEPSPDRGKIDICASHDGNFVRLSVADTGPGIPQGALLKEGIGLSTTRARLHELYGEQGALETDNESGFTITIKIPFRTAA
jgi:two-component system LytT family sensor kinase